MQKMWLCMERKIKMGIAKEYIFKSNRPFSYEPKKPQNKLHIRCPFRFFMESQGFSSECINLECALWLPIQRACSLQVIARGYK